MGWLDLSPEDQEKRWENQRRSFEETCVKKIIGHAGGKPHVAVKDAKLEGYEYADFTYLNGATEFPVIMFGARIAWMHEIQIPQLFGSEFTKTPFFKEYMKGMAQLDLDDTKERVGLVFRWPEFLGEAVQWSCTTTPFPVTI